VLQRADLTLRTPSTDWDFYTVVDGYVGPLAVDAAVKGTTDHDENAGEPGVSSDVDIPERPEELRWEVLLLN
jgi:hypothetical protein